MKVALLGPIKAWWQEWDSPRHKRYVSWRKILSETLVDGGHLVYRPHEAWKGTWSEEAQMVNDIAIYVVDVALNLTPEGVPSAGTDVEMNLCAYINRRVIAAPPPEGSIWSFIRQAQQIVDALGNLGPAQSVE